MERAVHEIERRTTPDVEPLLEAARCLAYLEINMPRAAALIDELAALHAMAKESVQYQWGRGLVEAWRGHLDAAREALLRAIDTAAAATDRWIEFECRARLVLLEIEQGDPQAAEAQAAELVSLADKLGAGSERPYADALVALCDLVRHVPEAWARLDDAIAVLDSIDAGFLAPDVLGLAAEHLLSEGNVAEAGRRAADALRMAQAAGRSTEVARAHALLARLAADRDDPATARSHLQAVADDPDGLPSHVEGLRREAERAASAENRR
jgi:tetratricopeptide (TPR) repeat protein